MLKIGFSLNRGDGGPQLFMKKLKKAFKSNRLAKTSYFFDPTVDANIFANKGHKGLIQKPYFFRADGVTFDAELPKEEIFRRNEPLKIGADNAIGIIYQSEYCQKMYQKILHVKNKKDQIIYNGTDLDIFTSNGENRRNEFGIHVEDLVFLTYANWRAHKRLKDTIAVYKIFRESNKEHNCKLIIIGAHNEDISDNDIISLGKLPHSMLPVLCRTANIFLFLSWLESCPNSVIEAMACGLPVVCTNQGGTGELVKFANGGIVAKADKEFEYHPVKLYAPPSPKYEPIIQAMKTISNNLKYHSNQIDKKKISIDYIAKRYIDFINKCF